VRTDRLARAGLGAIWISLLAIVVAGAVPRCLGAQPKRIVPRATLRREADTARTHAAERADSARRERATSLVNDDFARIGSLSLMIPEYHDEQRFPDDAGGYGPMAYIFATPNIGSFTSRAQIEDQGKAGALFALILVDTTFGAVLPTTYTNLGLVAGVNCLWLVYNHSAPLISRWQGYLTPRAASGFCVRTTSFPSMLSVQARSPGNRHHLDDYPQVGRFSEDDVGRPLLGVKCLDAWCEIGPPGFRAKPPSKAIAGREGNIKGWHDEQRLAAFDATGKLRPRLRASVIPEPHIDTLRVDHFAAGWVHVATIWFSDDPVGTKYATWGLRVGRNTLELRAVGGVWEARVTPSTDTATVWTNVYRHPHLDMAVPGTARFRWRNNDEGIWVPCGAACCRSDGDA
jgi:hypothetical protein